MHIRRIECCVHLAHSISAKILSQHIRALIFNHSSSYYVHIVLIACDVWTGNVQWFVILLHFRTTIKQLINDNDRNDELLMQVLGAGW